MIDAEDLHIGDAGDPRVLETALNGIGRVVFSAGGLLPAASEQAPGATPSSLLAQCGRCSTPYGRGRG